MNPPESDDDLRARFCELREEEAARAPSFGETRRRTVGDSSRMNAPVFWLRPAFVAVAVVLVAGGGWWMTWRPDDAQSQPAPLAFDAEFIDAPAIDFHPADEWATATAR